MVIPIPGASPLAVLYFGVTALFWLGHRFGSAWLAYCTEAYRPLMREEPIRFVVIPLLVTVACFAVFLPADDAYPWTRAERVVAMAILDYAFVTYHFAAQHFGALSLYRSRAERAGCVKTRRQDRIFALGVGGALVLVAEVLAGSAAYQDLWVHRWPVADWLVSNQEVIRMSALLVLLVATVFMLVTEARAPRRSMPRVLYILGLAAMVAIALETRSVFLFIVLWTSQHWILATGLASLTPGGEPAPAGGSVRRAFHALNTRPWAILRGSRSGFSLPAAFPRGRSQPGWRHVLRRPDLRRHRGGIAHFCLGPGIGSRRIRNRVHALPAGPQRVPDVGSPGPCGGARPPGTSLRGARSERVSNLQLQLFLGGP